MTVNSIEAGAEIIVMTGVNGVKYNDFQERLVTLEEHIAITGI